MEKEIKITNQPEIDDLTKASIYMLRTLPFIFVIPSIMILFSVTNAFLTPQSPDDINPAFLPLIILVVMIVCYFMLKNATKRTLIKNGKSLETQHFTLDSKGFAISGETYTTQYQWTNIPKIIETKSWFLIYTNKMAAQPIRKANLSDEQYKDIKELFLSLPIKKKLMP